MNKFLQSIGRLLAPVQQSANEAKDQLTLAFEVLIGEGAIVILLLLLLLFKRK